MKNFQCPLRKIISRDELKKIKGGGNCVPPPIGTVEGTPRRSVRCCSDLTEQCCSGCLTLFIGSSHCGGGNVLVNC